MGTIAFPLSQFLHSACSRSSQEFAQFALPMSRCPTRAAPAAPRDRLSPASGGSHSTRDPPALKIPQRWAPESTRGSRNTGDCPALETPRHQGIPQHWILWAQQQTLYDVFYRVINSCMFHSLKNGTLNFILNHATKQMSKSINVTTSTSSVL